MTLHRACIHPALASLAAVVLLFAADRPAFAQFGELLDKAKQAADSVRRAGDSARDVLGSGTTAPGRPAKGSDAPAAPAAGSAGGIDSTCLKPTGTIRWYYKNECGVDVTVLLLNTDRRTCSAIWLYAGQPAAIAPTSAVCRGRTERGPACACPAGTGMENPSGRDGEFGAAIRAPVGVVGGTARDAVTSAPSAQTTPPSASPTENVRVRSASLEGAPACLRHVSNESRGKLYRNDCATDLTLLMHRKDGQCIPFVVLKDRYEYVHSAVTVCTGRMDAAPSNCHCT